MTKRFYLRQPTAGANNVAINPSQCHSTTTPDANAFLYRALRAEKGGGPRANIAVTGLAQTTAQNDWCGCFISQPLKGGTYGSGTWTLALAGAEQSLNANRVFTVGHLYFWRKGTGKVGSVWDTPTVTFGGEVNINSGDPLGVVTTVAGANVTIQDGDRLVYEPWFRSATQTQATAYAAQVFFNGVTDVTNGTINSPASYIEAPADIPELTYQGHWDVRASSEIG